MSLVVFISSSSFVCSTEFIKVASHCHGKHLEIDTEKTGQVNFSQELSHSFLKDLGALGV